MNKQNFEDWYSSLVSRIGELPDSYKTLAAYAFRSGQDYEQAKAKERERSMRRLGDRL